MGHLNQVLACAVISYSLSSPEVNEFVRGGSNTQRIEPSNNNSPPHKSLSNLIQRGDIIARMGTGHWSRIIQRLSPTEKELSHVGILSKCDEGSWSVIHSMGGRFDGPNAVIRTPLAKFLQNSTRIEIHRTSETEEIQNSIAYHAESLIGRPFDHRFDITDYSQIYCTELVYIAVNKGHNKQLIQETQLASKVRMVTIKDCCDPTSFSLIHRSDDSRAPHNG